MKTPYLKWRPLYWDEAPLLAIAWLLITNTVRHHSQRWSTELHDIVKQHFDKQTDQDHGSKCLNYV